MHCRSVADVTLTRCLVTARHTKVRFATHSAQNLGQCSLLPHERSQPVITI